VEVSNQLVRIALRSLLQIALPVQDLEVGRLIATARGPWNDVIDMVCTLIERWDFKTASRADPLLALCDKLYELRRPKCRTANWVETANKPN